MTYAYDGLRDAYCLIQENEHRKARNLKSVQEVYGGRYGYRTTTSGRKVAFDEPNDEEQLRQSDAVRAAVQKKKTAASRARLKAQNKVPTKNGRKLFETFIKEARRKSDEPANLSVNDLEYLNQVYISARSLDFTKWIVFITEMLD